MFLGLIASIFLAALVLSIASIGEKLTKEVMLAASLFVALSGWALFLVGKQAFVVYVIFLVVFTSSNAIAARQA